MDLTNLKMAQGEPQWTSKHNGLVDAVQKVGGVTDQLQWTKYTKEGIVTGNLFELLPSSGYSYIQLGGQKIVHLHIDAKATHEFTGGYTGKQVTLPDEIALGQPILGRANDTYNWAYITENSFVFIPRNTGAAKITAGDMFYIDYVYVM